jgi:hypothetical protein
MQYRRAQIARYSLTDTGEWGRFPASNTESKPKRRRQQICTAHRCREREVNDLTPAAAAAEILPDARSGSCMASVFVRCLRCEHGAGAFAYLRICSTDALA